MKNVNQRHIMLDYLVQRLKKGKRTTREKLIAKEVKMGILQLQHLRSSATIARLV
jgi:hypothetical protein